MTPYGARVRAVHNSPIAIAVPGKKHPPIILDMATSVAAYGKLRVAMDKGESVPATWAVDEAGKPTTDPHQAVVLQPFGGYKGSGLAYMFESLSSLVVGVPMLIPYLVDDAKKPSPGTQNGVLAAIDIGAIADIERYKKDVDRLAGAITQLPQADGIDEIFVPGEPEDKVRQVRERDGVPLPGPVVQSLQEVAADLGVPLPAVMAGSAG
jgi:ureidoglycolate dehydrogenase (NAD+)